MRVDRYQQWMRIDSAAPLATTPPEAAEALRTRIQLQLLHKQLELQRQEAAALQSDAEGKGQRLDIRV